MIHFVYISQNMELLNDLSCRGFQGATWERNIVFQLAKIIGGVTGA